jgi:hypothetical protein
MRHDIYPNATSHLSERDFTFGECDIAFIGMRHHIYPNAVSAEKEPLKQKERETI